jgi:CheY-like chemotaxis protein
LLHEPVSKAPPAADPAAALAEGVPARSGLVLIVEDNPITRRLLRVALELGGFAVVDAADGRSALEILTRQRPDLLVLDFVLPDMDGLELLGTLRKTLGAEVPAIIVSGMVSQLQALRERGGPFTHFLPKPVEPSNLLDVVRAEMARPRAPAGGRRILVVDDEVLNRKLTSVRLEIAGYDVETVASGLEALVAARRNPPDAILADVMMPVMDGFSFCREARRDPALRAVPIILISAAYVDEEDRELTMTPRSSFASGIAMSRRSYASPASRPCMSSTASAALCGVFRSPVATAS